MLALFGVMVAFLAPPYYENWCFERFLGNLAHDPATEGRPVNLIHALVVDKAASWGLPVRTDDVQVSRTGSRTSIEVLFVIRIDLPFYSVDLHFRPRAS